MYNTRVSEYIKNGKAEHGLTYERIASESGVPLSTVHAYAKGSTAMPNEEYLIRIAAVFGDPPEVVYQLRASTAEAMDREKRLMSAATDKERMEQVAAIMRTNMLLVLDEYKAKTDAEQAHRIETVKAQYEAHIKSIEERCEKKIDMQEKFFERLLTTERDNAARMHEQYIASKEYLKTVIHNLSTALGVSVTLALAFGLYSVFAYRTFDMRDLTQGLAQHEHTAAPFVILLVFVCICVFFGGKFIFSKKAIDGGKQK